MRRPLPVRISRAHMVAQIACAGRRLAQVVALTVAHGGHERAAESCCNRRKRLRQRATRPPCCMRPMKLHRCAHGGRALRSMLRRWKLAGRTEAALLVDAGGTLIARRCVIGARRCARRASCLARRRTRLPCVFRVAPPPTAAPASLLRCHDGWSEFF
ncbi:hypothetical protein F511_47133 [Dorcoceras hygrometricum]|uniref:Uncharacterized protein n=1 Tax=Dorcoceras hygrometricum TaxID=472368 RepID=A0A2Z6ZRT3_9LAMI|nr:hypothetical protein F511_47133 [Dorcoceras hygrometricum]